MNKHVYSFSFFGEKLVIYMLNFNISKLERALRPVFSMVRVRVRFFFFLLLLL